MSIASTEPCATQDAYLDFLSRFDRYTETSSLDEARKRDFSLLDKSGCTYLDYTGSSLYSRAQIDSYAELITTEVFGNPHSTHFPSMRSTEELAKAEASVLDFFAADSTEYSVIFTANATAAVKLLAESFPFRRNSALAILADNHNSVLGMREFARSNGSTVTMAPINQRSLRIEENKLREILDNRPQGPSLFTYPAQSNFTGVQHSLEWIDIAQRNGWTVLLDAAAYVPTSKLELTRYKPDFVAISFYKMFGWPTGIGCLIARNAALAQLERPWFAGGTVTAASARREWHVPAPNAEAFADGTPDFLGTLGVSIGLDYLRRLGIDSIHTRVNCLTDWLLEELPALRHNGGSPVCAIYGPNDTNARGATIALNFLDGNGDLVDDRIVAHYATAWNIALRTGCFCNPGVGENVFNISEEKLAALSTENRDASVDWYITALGLPTGGAIRISLGHMTNFADAHRFLRFATAWCNWYPEHADIELAPRAHC